MNQRFEIIGLRALKSAEFGNSTDRGIGDMSGFNDYFCQIACIDTYFGAEEAIGEIGMLGFFLLVKIPEKVTIFEIVEDRFHRFVNATKVTSLQTFTKNVEKDIPSTRTINSEG
jgi:hypothetical protein